NLSREVTDPGERSMFANHLWLHARVHAPPEQKPISMEDVLAMPTVQIYLVPAARAFLDARRCCPYLPIPHAELAALDFLREGADPARVELARALRLSGVNGPVMMIVEQLTAQLGDRDLLAVVLRKSLMTFASEEWPRVADRAARFLPPDEILTRVVPT